jgi:hypothetical protein
MSPLEPHGSQPHELGGGREVPVSVGHMAVTEVSRELGQMPLDVGALAIPIEKCLDGESVPLIPSSE